MESSKSEGISQILKGSSLSQKTRMAVGDVFAFDRRIVVPFHFPV
jgi:hypothetical protein